jgi:hypothetical protein
MGYNLQGAILSACSFLIFRLIATYSTESVLMLSPYHNTDGIFNRFVTVFANRARHVRGELSLGRESEAIKK